MSVSIREQNDPGGSRPGLYPETSNWTPWYPPGLARSKTEVKRRRGELTSIYSPCLLGRGVSIFLDALIQFEENLRFVSLCPFDIPIDKPRLR